MHRMLDLVFLGPLAKIRFSRKFHDVMRAMVQPMLWFGLAFIGLIWLALFQLVGQQQTAALRDSEQETANLSLIVSQNVQRTADSLNRILTYLQDTYRRDGYAANWSRLVDEKFTIDHQVVQIAVIDQSGFLIASSKLLHPIKPLFLGDRPHFIFQKNAKKDSLFISQPVQGRVSGKQSVQFTRRLEHADGSFAGVLVISLDPKRLASSFSVMHLGRGYGFALVGDDGVVRSGAGIYANLVGGNYQHLEGTYHKEIYGSAVADDLSDGNMQISASRAVDGYPLDVIVTTDYSKKAAAWKVAEQAYIIGASILSLIVLLVMFMMAAARQRFDTKMNFLARHDALTGLSNRFDLGEMLDVACAKLSENGSFSLHLIDLDGFKLINDAYGHPVGDKLLKLTAQRLRSVLRSTDVVARLGGDEFAVVQRGTNQDEGVVEVAKRICEIIATPFELDGLQVKIGASIGIARSGVDGSNADELLRQADLALYGAKANGRGTYCFYSQALSDKALVRGELETGLSNALQRNELALFYQPIVSVATGEVVSFEALLRWRHPQRGLVSPLDFIPLAEETGLIVPIGEWIFEQACTDLAACPENLTVSINCSPVQLNSNNLIPSVKLALQRSGLNGNRLRVEITESTLMRDDGVALARLEELRALGVKISIDDFGTGYSCLGYLQRYPVDCIKIDRSFISSMGGDHDGKPIVSAIIGLATGLKMSTVAEGIETAEQLRQITEMGCTEAQGYLFSPPRPASEILPKCDKVKVAA